MTINSECLGCRLSNKLEPVNVVYENEYVCCFLDIEPHNEGHTLILPKKHYNEVEELDLETANADYAGINDDFKGTKKVSKA